VEIQAKKDRRRTWGPQRNANGLRDRSKEMLYIPGGDRKGMLKSGVTGKEMLLGGRGRMTILQVRGGRSGRTEGMLHTVGEKGGGRRERWKGEK
jgi:hypothetical protein